MENTKQLNPLEHSDSKNKPSKVVLSIPKQELWKKIKCANQKQLNKELNDIIWDNRKNISLYYGLSKSQIIATNHILIAELKLFLKNNDVPLNLFD